MKFVFIDKQLYIRVKAFIKMRIINALKAFSWVLLAYFFGLLQLWLIVLANFVLKNMNFNFNAYLLDGSILFFATAVTSTIVIDYYFDKGLSLPKVISGFLYGLVPFLCILFCVFLFAIFLSLRNVININGINQNIADICYVNEIRYIEYALLATVSVYALISKYIQFEYNYYRRSS